LILVRLKSRIVNFCTGQQLPSTSLSFWVDWTRSLGAFTVDPRSCHRSAIARSDLLGCHHRPYLLLPTLPVPPSSALCCRLRSRSDRASPTLRDLIHGSIHLFRTCGPRPSRRATTLPFGRSIPTVSMLSGFRSLCCHSREPLFADSLKLRAS
jgi:hypothetical protein